MSASQHASLVEWLTALHAGGKVDPQLASSFDRMIELTQRSSDWVFESSQSGIPKQNLLSTLQIRRANFKRAGIASQPDLDTSISIVQATDEQTQFRLTWARTSSDGGHMLWLFLDDAGVVRVAVHLRPLLEV
jgi:hypothetical protein